MKNDINNFKIHKNDFLFLGENLHRPECVITTQENAIWVSDARGGVTRIGKHGNQQHFGFNLNVSNKTPLDGKDLPNGLCFTLNRKLLIANLGKNCLEEMNLFNGERIVLVDSIDGKPLGKVNYVLEDSKGKIYLTVSTNKDKWIDSINTYTDDGYIAVIENGIIRIIMDNLKFPNEIRFDKNEEFLYLAETCGQVIKRFKLNKNGNIINTEIFGPSNLGDAGFPDGIAFDTQGNLWGTLAAAEKIFCITPEGDIFTVFDDGCESYRKLIQAAFEAGTIDESILLGHLSTIAPLMTSIAFGGDELNTIYVGSVLGKSIPYIKTPFNGLKPLWWDYI